MWRSKSRSLTARAAYAKGSRRHLRIAGLSGLGWGDLPGGGINDAVDGLVLLRPGTGGVITAEGLSEPIVVAVYGKDADVMGEPIQQRAESISER